MDDDTTTTGAPPRQRRMERSRSDRWLTGVCGGLGAYFGVDPILFRIAVIVLTVAGGAGLWLYLAAWLLLPEQGSSTSVAQHALGHRRGLATIAAVVLIAIGVGNLTSEVHIFHGGRIVWALLLIGGGIYIFRSTAGDRPEVDDPPISPEPPATPPPAPVTTPDATVPWSAPAALPPEGRSITPFVISALLVGGGLAAFLDAADVVHLSVAPVLAVCVLVTGIALVITTWWGRGRGLIPVGVLLALALGVATTVDSLDVPLRGDVGDRQWRPTDISAVRPAYRLRMGTMTIDLTGVSFTGTDRSITATVGVGELVVLVPEGVGVDVTARAGMGAVQLFGRREVGGVGILRSASVTPASPDTGHVTLRLKTGIGRVEVNRQVNLRLNPDRRLDAPLNSGLEVPRAAA
jgi:phage shock protein PspC (stress-responsive transcriptional regulator)